MRRALAIQLIINREWGLAMNENPNQGAFVIEELTDLVEAAVMPGFDTTNVLTMRMSLAGKSYQTSLAIEQMVRHRTERLNALPGVELASAGCCVPLEQKRLWFALQSDGPAVAERQHGMIAAEVDVRLVSIGVVGMLNSAWLWYQPSGSRSTAEIAAEFVKVIVAGVASDGAFEAAGSASSLRTSIAGT